MKPGNKFRYKTNGFEPPTINFLSLRP